MRAIPHAAGRRIAHDRAMTWPANTRASADVGPTIEIRPTRERILDAAEDAFAREGYFAATIRGITQAAGVELSLSRYHFGSKDELFRQVLARRADAICSMLEASLARAGAHRPPTLRAVVESMVVPAIERLASGDPGWRNYLRLLASFGLLNERHDLLAPWRERYAPTLAQYRRALAAALPGAPDHAVGWGLHFLQILVGHALLDLGIVRYLEGVPDAPVPWHEMREQLVRHVVAGLRAQCKS